MAPLVALWFLAALAASSPTTKQQQPWDLSADVSEIIKNGTLVGRDAELSKRQDGGVYICEDINWGGKCGYAKQPWDVCIRLDSPWWQTISSIGPDQYNAIVAYTDYNCQSPWYKEQIAIFNPGYADLRTVGWNDRIGSFKVFQIPAKNCLPDLDSHPAIDDLVDCNDCCTGCNRSGTGCCPAGVFC